MARRARPPATKRPAVPRGMGWKRIYDALRAQILSLELPPGAGIDEAAVVRAFGVSRTPVREAIIRLASDGLVTQLPNRGARVAPLDLTRIRDYLESVDLCQRAATRWAAVRHTAAQLDRIRTQAAEFERAVRSRDSDRMVRANREFHAAIGAACGNVHIADAYERILTEGLRIARFTLSGLYYRSEKDFAGFVAAVVHEHREMVAAIGARDADRAEAVAAVHTDHTRSRFVTYLNDTLSPQVQVSPPERGQPR